MRNFAKPDGRRTRRIAVTGALAAALVGATYVATSPAQAESGFPKPTIHTQRAHSPYSDFTAKWTRADARQIEAQSDPTVAPGENSLPDS